MVTGDYLGSDDSNSLVQVNWSLSEVHGGYREGPSLLGKKEV